MTGFHEKASRVKYQFRSEFPPGRRGGFSSDCAVSSDHPPGFHSHSSRAMASEMCLSGRLVEAEEAVAHGLANRVVPAEKLVDEALAQADAIAANPDRQLRMIKQLLTRNGSDPDLDAVMKREFELLRACYTSPEHSEAIAAFTEKRTPKFR